MPGCGSAWLEHLVWGERVAGSNPATQTISLVCADRIMGVRKVVALEVAGSIPRLRTIMPGSSMVEHATDNREMMVQFHSRRPIPSVAQR